MSDISYALRSELRDPEYSEGYAESFLNSYVATQIKVIREQRQMKQSDLARAIGTTQTAISRIENVNYSSWNIKTLKKLARAFRVRLRVSFETYGSLPYEVLTFGRDSLQRASREEDPSLIERIGPRREESTAHETVLAVANATPAGSSMPNNLIKMMTGKSKGEAKASATASGVIEAESNPALLSRENASVQLLGVEAPLSPTMQTKEFVGKETTKRLRRSTRRAEGKAKWQSRKQTRRRKRHLFEGERTSRLSTQTTLGFTQASGIYG